MKVCDEMSRKKNYIGDGYYTIDNDTTHYSTVSEAKRHIRIQYRNQYNVKVGIYRNNVQYGVYWIDRDTNRLVGVRK